MNRITPKQRINIAITFLIAAVVQFMQGVNKLSQLFPDETWILLHISAGVLLTSVGIYLFASNKSYKEKYFIGKKFATPESSDDSVLSDEFERKRNQIYKEETKEYIKAYYVLGFLAVFIISAYIFFKEFILGAFAITLIILIVVFLLIFFQHMKTKREC